MQIGQGYSTTSVVALRDLRAPKAHEQTRFSGGEGTKLELSRKHRDTKTQRHQAHAAFESIVCGVCLVSLCLGVSVFTLPVAVSIHDSNGSQIRARSPRL